MPTKSEMKERLLKDLRSDMTVMLGVESQKHQMFRPMTAQFQAANDTIWFFTSRDTLIVKELKKAQDAIFTFVSRKNDLFATVHGKLSLDNDRKTIDALWNRYIAAWYEKGKDDPKLALLRMDCKTAEIWLDDSTLFAGIKMMIGMDPKEDYQDNVAKVTF